MTSDHVNEGVLRQADACLLELAAQAGVSRRDGLTATANTLDGCAAVLKRLRNFTDAALASTAGAGAGDWQPLNLLAPQTNAMLGRWCRCGDREDGSEHWYWQQAFGRYFDFQGERHWCLDGHQFEAGPFYGETPTHFYAVASAPSRQSPAVPASPRSGAGEDSALLDMIASHGLAVIPQANGGWVIEGDDGSGEQEVEIVRTRERLRPALREAARTLGWDLPDSPTAPAEHGVEIRAISSAQLRELSALADWLERDSSENDAENVRAAVSALSQGGGTGRSERAVEIRERVPSGAFDAAQHWQLSEETRAYLREIDLATVQPGDPRLNTVVGPAGPAAGMDGYGSQARPLSPAPSPAPAQSPSTSDREG